MAVQQGNLVVRFKEGTGGRVYCDAQWRYRLSDDESWKIKKRRVGLARLEPDGSGGWRKRPGRRPEGWFDERAANIEAVATMEAFA